MTEAARRRVEAALEVARRPTTLPGERAAALAAAERLVTSNRLDRASFKWPGEERKDPPPSRFADDLFTRPRSPAFTADGYSEEELSDVLRRFREHLAESIHAEAFSRTMYGRPSDAADAFAFAAAAKAHTAAQAAARERRRAEAQRTTESNRAAYAAARRQMDGIAADVAVNWLWRNEIRVYPTTVAEDGSRRWVAPEASELEYSDAGIIEFAKAAGYEP